MTSAGATRAEVVQLAAPVVVLMVVFGQSVLGEPLIVKLTVPAGFTGALAVVVTVAVIVTG
jgi:hypothetical protein